MTTTDSIREHLEAIRDESEYSEETYDLVEASVAYVLKPIHAHAVAALRVLDEDFATFRLVLEEIRDNERYLAAHEMAAIAAAALDRLTPDSSDA